MELRLPSVDVDHTAVFIVDGILFETQTYFLSTPFRDFFGSVQFDGVACM
jgi:hypothetical protein